MHDPRACACPTLPALGALALTLASCVGKEPDPDIPATGGVETGLIETGDPAAPDLLLIADTSHGRYLFVRPDTATIVHQVSLATLNPDLCTDAVCAAFVAWPTLGAELDEITLSFAPNTDGASYAAVIERVRLGEDEDTVLWRLDSLDFLSNFPDRPEICAQIAPCEVPEDADETVRRKCRLQLSHEAKVVSEDDGSVALWIADTEGPARAIKVRLDKGSTCGVVEDVLSEETAARWAGYQAINDLDLVDLGDGRETLLLNSLSHDSDEGLASVTLWQAIDGLWTPLWQHPSEASGGFLGAAHNPDWITDSDGASYIVYAHSNGMGAHPEVRSFTGADDHRGSIGLARVTPEGAEYLVDAALPGQFGFLRDVNRLADGSFLVTDSGCMHPDDTDCSNPGQLWRVALPELSSLSPSGRSGAFTASHGDMDVIVATPLTVGARSPLTCGLFTPYSAQFMPGASLGATLRAMLDSPGEACPTE